MMTLLFLDDLANFLASSIKSYDQLASKLDTFADHSVELANKLKKLEASASTPKKGFTL